MNKVKFPCGKEAKYKDDTGSIGNVRKQTGFQAVMTYTGEWIYLCPKCFSEAQEHAEAIMKIVKSRYLYFPHLLKKETLDRIDREEEKK